MGCVGQSVQFVPRCSCRMESCGGGSWGALAESRKPGIQTCERAIWAAQVAWRGLSFNESRQTWGVSQKEPICPLRSKEKIFWNMLRALKEHVFSEEETAPSSMCRLLCESRLHSLYLHILWLGFVNKVNLKDRLIVSWLVSWVQDFECWPSNSKCHIPDPLRIHFLAQTSCRTALRSISTRM